MLQVLNPCRCVCMCLQDVHMLILVSQLRVCAIGACVGRYTDLWKCIVQIYVMGVCICKCVIGVHMSWTHMSVYGPPLCALDWCVAAMACGRSVGTGITRSQC